MKHVIDEQKKEIKNSRDVFYNTKSHNVNLSKQKQMLKSSFHYADNQPRTDKIGTITMDPKMHLSFN